VVERLKDAEELQQEAPGDPVEELETELLLEGIWRRYGLDFRGYSRQSLRRRVRNVLRAQRLESVSQLQSRVLRDAAAMDRLVEALSVNTTTMFRDTTFWRAFRERVVPQLFALPFVRVWHAGCSTGEEVYSLAILLSEAGLYERSRIYATDLNAAVVERARSGVFALDRMQEYTANYVRAGGSASFSDYYVADHERAIFKAPLRRNVVFAQHNLVSDGTFNEFNVVLCRNVLIYFDTELQNRVHRLLDGSLRRFGVLALGRGETLRHTVLEGGYETLDEGERLYRKRG
jgi:chemotaxis protein methyltransferase CheR